MQEPPLFHSAFHRQDDIFRQKGGRGLIFQPSPSQPLESEFIENEKLSVFLRHIRYYEFNKFYLAIHDSTEGNGPYQHPVDPKAF